MPKRGEPRPFPFDSGSVIRWPRTARCTRGLPSLYQYIECTRNVKAELGEQPPRHALLEDKSTRIQGKGTSRPCAAANRAPYCQCQCQLCTWCFLLLLDQASWVCILPSRWPRYPERLCTGHSVLGTRYSGLRDPDVGLEALRACRRPEPRAIQ